MTQSPDGGTPPVFQVTQEEKEVILAVRVPLSLARPYFKSKIDPFLQLTPSAKPVKSD